MLIYSKKLEQFNCDNYHLLKVISDKNQEYYTCSIKRKDLWPGHFRQFVVIPLEHMQDLIRYLRRMFNIAEKNKASIYAMHLPTYYQWRAFMVPVYRDEKWEIDSNIAVSSLERPSYVVIHQSKVHNDAEPTEILLTFNNLMNLSLAIDDAEAKVNMLEADIKSKRKYKEGMFYNWPHLRNLLHLNIAALCGVSQ